MSEIRDDLVHPQNSKWNINHVAGFSPCGFYTLNAAKAVKVLRRHFNKQDLPTNTNCSRIYAPDSSPELDGVGCSKILKLSRWQQNQLHLQLISSVESVRKLAKFFQVLYPTHCSLQMKRLVTQNRSVSLALLHDAGLHGAMIYVHLPPGGI